MTMISRRHALMGATAGLALSACGVKGQASDTARPASAPALSPPGADELARLDAIGTADLIRKGEVSSLEVVEAAIRRAAAVEPKLNGIVNDTFDLAMAQAKSPGAGPFAGVPTFVKDLSDITGQPTEFGSRAFKGYIAETQAPFADAFLASGLISLGKSTTPESGAISTTEPIAHGPTRNPWNPEHSCGGSSGGAAALTAARVVPMAWASDGGGSIRIPASCCGLFGLKPSRGRTLPTRLGAPPQVDLSVVLSVSRSVRDTAALLDLVERKGDDAAFTPVGNVTAPGKRRLTIGLSIDPLVDRPVDAEVRAAIEDVAKLCESLGHTVKPVRFDVDGKAFSDAFLLYWAAGSAEFAESAARFTGKPIGPDILEPWSLGLVQYYAERKDQLESAIRTLQSVEPMYESAMSDAKIDVLLTPTLAAPPPAIGMQDPRVDFDILLERVLDYAPYTPLQNASGAAAMSVPLSWSAAGLPIGSHFAGRKGDEAMLLALAYELELARPWADRLPAVYA